MHKGRINNVAIFSCVSFVALMALLVACATAGGPSGGKTLLIKDVKLPGLRHTVSPGRYVFTSQEKWEDFWSRYHTTPAPEFDFRHSTLVSVFQGMKPNPGHSVEIAAATEYRDEVVVQVVEYLPSPELMYPQIIVYPFDAVLIPATSKPVRFETRQTMDLPEH